VVVNAAGTVAPGNVANAIGTLSVGGGVTLGGTAAMQVIKGGGIINDTLSVVGNLTMGGTLQVVHSGEPLAAGDAFLLFSFGSASGSFASIVPATPGAGLKWDTSELVSAGTLRVVSSEIRFNSVSQSGTNLVMSAQNGPAGATFYILSTTNLELPLSNWAPIYTNVFDASGAFNVQQAVDPGTPKRFFMIQVP
jgi:hypothetical protein